MFWDLFLWSLYKHFNQLYQEALKTSYTHCNGSSLCERLRVYGWEFALQKHLLDGWMKKRCLYIPSPLPHFLHLIWACCCHAQRAGLIGPNGPPVTHQGLRFAGGTVTSCFPPATSAQATAVKLVPACPSPTSSQVNTETYAHLHSNTCHIDPWTNKDLSLLTRSTHQTIDFCSAGIISLSSSALSKWHDRTNALHWYVSCSICTHTFDTWDTSAPQVLQTQTWGC